MLTRGGGGVTQKLTIADEGGVYELPILADVICEQPLRALQKKTKTTEIFPSNVLRKLGTVDVCIYMIKVNVYRVCGKSRLSQVAAVISQMYHCKGKAI